MHNLPTLAPVSVCNTTKSRNADQRAHELGCGRTRLCFHTYTWSLSWKHIEEWELLHALLGAP